MYQLIMKDILTQRRVAFIAPFFLLFYFLTVGKDVTTLVSVQFSLGIGFIAYFIMMYSNFNTNEGDTTQNQLLLSMPVSRRSVINAKYLMIAVWWLCSFGISFVLITVLNLVQKNGGFGWLSAQTIVGSLCVTYLLSAFFYPFLYKFGYRVASFLGVAIFFAIPASLGAVMRSNLPIDHFQFVASHPMFSLIVITFVIVTASYVVSHSIFQKKEI